MLALHIPQPQALQTRNRDKLEACADYLYYLMTGLEALPPHKQANGVLWRGVDRCRPPDCCLARLMNACREIRLAGRRFSRMCLSIHCDGEFIMLCNELSLQRRCLERVTLSGKTYLLELGVGGGDSSGKMLLLEPRQIIL